MSLLLENITKVYGEQKALNNVSFSAKKGEIIALLGPNGAGKSTSMKILSCFLQSDEGTAMVCGYDVKKNPQEVKNRLGYLPENNPLYFDMYIKEYLQFVSEIHKIRDKKNRVEEVIDLVGLEQEQSKKIGQLSKGYKQRVGIAQAIIHDPEVLILDEPTSGLDPNQLAEVRNLIQKLGAEKTVILSTHIMQEVEAICDRVVVINKGEIVADKATTAFVSAPSDQAIVTIELLQGLDVVHFEKIKGVQDIKKIGNKKIKIYSNKDLDIRPQIFDIVVQYGDKLLSMQQEEQGIEDVFKKLTNTKN